jgi:hypothetical protein
MERGSGKRGTGHGARGTGGSRLRAARGTFVPKLPVPFTLASIPLLACPVPRASCPVAAKQGVRP